MRVCASPSAGAHRWGAHWRSAAYRCPRALAQALLLGGTLLVGQGLRRLRVKWIGDAGAALLLGIVIGLIIKAAGAGPDFASLVSFNVSRAGPD